MSENKMKLNQSADAAEKAENMQKELHDEQLNDVAGGFEPPRDHSKEPTKVNKDVRL